MAGNDPDYADMLRLTETTRPSWLLVVRWYFWFYLTLYSLRRQTLKWIWCSAGVHKALLHYDIYTIIIVSCIGHAYCWYHIPYNAMLKSAFLTLRDKFRDKFLSVTAKWMLSWAGIDPWFSSIRRHCVESSTLSRLLLFHMYFFSPVVLTCTFLYQSKTNSQDSVLDSTRCRMLGNHGSIPAELNTHFSVCMTAPSLIPPQRLRGCCTKQLVYQC